MAQDMKAAGDRDGAAFWRFSLALYAVPAVSAALLELQDRAGRDVNLVLYALWLGAVRACRLDCAALAAVAAEIEPIAAVVAELRGQRRRLRQAEDPLLQGLRRRFAALELAGERCVHDRLAASRPVIAAADNRLAIASANLALYLGADATSPEAAVLRGALARLMRRDYRLRSMG